MALSRMYSFFGNRFFVFGQFRELEVLDGNVILHHEAWLRGDSNNTLYIVCARNGVGIGIIPCGSCKRIRVVVVPVNVTQAYIMHANGSYRVCYQNGTEPASFLWTVLDLALVRGVLVAVPLQGGPYLLSSGIQRRSLMFVDKGPSLVTRMSLLLESSWRTKRRVTVFGPSLGHGGLLSCTAFHEYAQGVVRDYINSMRVNPCVSSYSYLTAHSCVNLTVAPTELRLPERWFINGVPFTPLHDPFLNPVGQRDVVRVVDGEAVFGVLHRGVRTRDRASREFWDNIELAGRGEFPRSMPLMLELSEVRSASDAGLVRLGNGAYTGQLQDVTYSDFCQFGCVATLRAFMSSNDIASAEYDVLLRLGEWWMDGNVFPFELVLQGAVGIESFPTLRAECPVCYETKVCCVLKCRHSACEDCLEALFLSPLADRCPICREPI